MTEGRGPNPVQILAKAAAALEQMGDNGEMTAAELVRRHDQAVCIERLHGKHVQTLALTLGGVLPLHVGAGPQVLLAYGSEQFREAYLSGRRFQRLTPKTSTSARQVRRDLDEIRRFGYAVSDEDVTVGIAALGAPIFDHTGQIRAALSISGVKPAILGGEVEKLKRLVVEGAAEVSRALGCGQPDGRP